MIGEAAFRSISHGVFPKLLTPKVLGEINELIVRDAKGHREKEVKSNDNDDSDDHTGSSGNISTMIVDSTCALSNIRYPQNVFLLNESRENTEKLLDVLLTLPTGKEALCLPQVCLQGLPELYKVPQK